MLTGTMINVVTIILGSSLGLLLNKKIPKNIWLLVMQGLGIFTLALGVQMASKSTNPLITISSLIIGGIVGEIAQLDVRLDRFAQRVKETTHSKSHSFTEGFVTACVLFCVGSMGILGAINDGLYGDHTLLLTKSALDGFSSVALAASLGIGVLFSAIPVLFYQGSITILAGYAHNLFSPILIAELTGVGGIIILGVGINLLNLKKLKTINLLPALLIVVILVSLFK